MYARSARALGERSTIFFEGIFITLVIGVDFPYQRMQLEGVRIEVREPLDDLERGVHVQSSELIECVGIFGIPRQRQIELGNGVISTAERHQSNGIVVVAPRVRLWR